MHGRPGRPSSIRTMSVTRTWCSPAALHNRLATTTAGPNTSPSSSVTSPTATPTRSPSPGTLRARSRPPACWTATAAATASAALPKDARQPSPIVLTSTPSPAPMAVENTANRARLASSARSTPSRPNSSVEPTMSAISTVTVRLRDTPRPYARGLGSRPTKGPPRRRVAPLLPIRRRMTQTLDRRGSDAVGFERLQCTLDVRGVARHAVGGGWRCGMGDGGLSLTEAMESLRARPDGRDASGHR